MQWVLRHAAHWHYLWFGALVFMEGPTTTIAGAVLAASGVLDPWKVFWTAVLANLAADAFWCGDVGGGSASGHWMEKVEKRYPLVRPLERKLRERAVAFLLFAKFTLSGVPWRKLLGAVLLGEISWIAFLTFVGYMLWDKITYLAVGFRVAAVVGFVVFVFVITRAARNAMNEWLAEETPAED